jgi:hypothetical protein
LENISDTVVAVKTVNGKHALPFNHPHLKQQNRIKIWLGSSINAITKVKTEKSVQGNFVEVHAN